MTKPKASPPTPQPKQWKMFFCGLTVKDGVFSAWKGHRPFQCDPALRRFTNRLTRSTMSTAARMSSSSACEYCILPDLQRGHRRPRAALRRLAVAERLDQRVPGQEVAHRLSEGAAALAMYQSYAREAREKGVVEIFLDAVARLVGGLSQQHDLTGHRPLRGPDRVAASRSQSPRHPRGPVPRALSWSRPRVLRSRPEGRKRHAHRDRAGPDRRRASSDLD